MCVCVGVRTCITCPVGAGVRFAYDTACQNASAIDALLCGDGKKKCISIVTLNGSVGMGFALGDCCHGDELNCCLRHRIR